MKIFEIKTYDFAGNFKKQINPRNITSRVEFSENINGVQGYLTLSIIGEIEDYEEGDIVEIREMEEGSKPIIYTWNDFLNWDDSETWKEEESNITETYTGIIERIGIEEYEDKEVLNIEILGLGTALNDILYKDGVSLSVNKNTTADAVAKDIIDYFNSQYGVLEGETQNIGTSLFYYDSESIPTTTININRNFEKINCYKALESIADEIGFYFFIEPTGKVHFKELGEEKVMTFRREIIKIERKRKKDEMVNRYFLEESGNNTKIYNNIVSQGNYNLKELYEAKTDINDTTTQDEIGNKKIEEYGVPRFETSVIIKPQVSNNLYPGMLLTTQNTKNSITEQKITKITKGTLSWTIYIGDYTSIGKVI